MKPDAIARIEEAEARIAAAVEERRARQKEGDHRSARAALEVARRSAEELKAELARAAGKNPDDDEPKSN